MSQEIEFRIQNDLNFDDIGEFEDFDEIQIAKDDLNKATVQLSQVADHCEAAFKEPKIIESRNIDIEDAKEFGLYGSEELDKTAQTVICALQGVCESIQVLAENTLEKLDDLSLNIDELGQDIEHISRLQNLYENKVNFKRIKPLTVENKVTKRPIYKRNYEFDRESAQWKPFAPLDFNILDQVGHKYVPKEIPEKEPNSDPEDDLVPKVPEVFYAPNRKFATLTKNKKSGGMKKSSSKTSLLSRTLSMRSTSSKMESRLSRLPQIPGHSGQLRICFVHFHLKLRSSIQRAFLKIILSNFPCHKINSQLTIVQFMTMKILL